MRSPDERLGRGLSRPRPSLGPLRAGGKAHRLRGLSPALAFQPRHDGRAHHRPQARHRRHLGRRLPQAHAGDRTLSRTLARAYADVSASPRRVRSLVDLTLRETSLAGVALDDRLASAWLSTRSTNSKPAGASFSTSSITRSGPPLRLRRTISAVLGSRSCSYSCSACIGWSHFC